MRSNPSINELKRRSEGEHNLKLKNELPNKNRRLKGEEEKMNSLKICEEF